MLVHSHAEASSARLVAQQLFRMCFLGGASGSAAHPLRAAAWIPLEADLSEANWSALLIAAGFHPELPTAWLAEGLLMYIQPPAVDAMLREMAGAHPYYGCAASASCNAFCHAEACSTSPQMSEDADPVMLPSVFRKLSFLLRRRLGSRVCAAGNVCDRGRGGESEGVGALPRP